MPTGYTADVQSGKIDTLPDFAMRCARAFGACITMRDDPSDAAIPNEFEPSDYHAKALEQSRAELQRLTSLTEDQVAANAETYNGDRLATWKRRRQKKLEQADRYRSMLNKVRAWEPPTSDHEGLRTFMITQLEESIDFDCSDRYPDPEPAPVSPAQWLADRLSETRKTISMHEAEDAKERERAATRTEWVRALRASLIGAR